MDSPYKSIPHIGSIIGCSQSKQMETALLQSQKMENAEKKKNSPVIYIRVQCN